MQLHDDVNWNLKYILHTGCLENFKKKKNWRSVEESDDASCGLTILTCVLVFRRICIKIHAAKKQKIVRKFNFWWNLIMWVSCFKIHFYEVKIYVGQPIRTGNLAMVVTGSVPRARFASEVVCVAHLQQCVCFLCMYQSNFLSLFFWKKSSCTLL